MKKRVYKIKNKILVQSNENELTEDEILVKEENGSVLLKERVNGEVFNIVVKGGNPTPTEVSVNASSETLSISTNVMVFTLDDEFDVSTLHAPTKLNITMNVDNQQIIISLYILAVNGGAFSGYIESQMMNTVVSGLFLSLTTIRLYVMS